MQVAQLGVILRCILMVHIQSNICNGCFKGFYSCASCIAQEATGGGFSSTWVGRVDQGVLLRFLSLKQGIYNFTI